jgi:hypothetical protein
MIARMSIRAQEYQPFISQGIVCYSLVNCSLSSQQPQVDIKSRDCAFLRINPVGDLNMMRTDKIIIGK